MLFKWWLNWFRFFSCDEAVLWMIQFVCPSARLSVCHTFFTMSPSSYHHFSGGIAIGRSDVHAKGQGQWSKFKVTWLKTPFNFFRTVTLVWIHILHAVKTNVQYCNKWNDAKSWMWHRKCAYCFLQGHLSNFKVTKDKNRRFWPELDVSRRQLHF